MQSTFDLINMCALALAIGSRSLIVDHPVPIKYLMPTTPSYVGASDASKAGMGGVWYPTLITGNSRPEDLALTFSPTIWCAPFPKFVDNPMGTKTNSDLELTGMIMHADILAHATPLQHSTI